jgi:hypothetical protein
MSSTAPKTTGQAASILATLQEKRSALTATIAGAADRCRGLVVAAHFDTDAADELTEIEAEAATARAALKNLDLAIDEVAQMRDALAARETVIRDSRNVAELAATVEQLLELADQCDDALDFARELLERREAFKREKALILRRASIGKLLGSMIGREGEVALAVGAYFDKWQTGGSYSAITRIAEFDGRYYGKSSPRMIERGPRTLTPFEKMMQREIVSRSAPPIEAAAIPRQAARRR